MKRYKNIEEFTKNIHKTKIQDWYYIAGHWYTIEDYDENGREMIYKSLTAKNEIVITTPDNRYETGLKSARVEEIGEPMYYRFRPEYYVSKSTYKRLSKDKKRELVKYISQVWGEEYLLDFLF